MAQTSRFSVPSGAPFRGLGAAPRPTVLVVDDERALAELTVSILELEGFEARLAHSAEEALGMVRQWLPQTVLLDIVLPRMNGVVAALRLAREFPGLRIILISGQADLADLLEPARVAGYEFPVLAKPVPPDELVRFLRARAAPGRRGAAGGEGRSNRSGNKT